jgi:carboxypeptidase C (cathepsin A)
MDYKSSLRFLMNVRAAIVGILFLLSTNTLAQTISPTTAPTSRPAPSPADVKVSVTAQQITLNGKSLAYTATAGDLIIKDESGKPRADMFFVAYRLDPAGDPATRPITFLFNGGPGAAAVWLHLGGAGPRVIELDTHDLPVGPPYKLVDNPATWLGATDLVFIDPVSTGYSRPAPGVKADEFHGVHQDIASIADFIRLYTTQYQRWASPIYLAGESYGTTRAAALAGHLADRYGIAVNGIVLMSSVLDFQSLITRPGNDEPFVMYLPSYAAVAWYHHKLSSELQADFNKTIEQAKTFAVEQYAPALAKGASLSTDQRAQIVNQLAAFTGLSADLVDRSNLRIDPGLFEKELLGDGHHIIGRFDGRIIGYDPNAISHSPSYDPSLSQYLPAYSATFNDYVRRVLKYKSDLPYEVLTNQVQPWSFGQEGGGYLYVIDDLQSAILQNPHLRVMFVSGYFDLATPFFSADHAINRMNLGPDLRKNVTHEYFPTGHMVYHHREAAMKLAQDIAKFVGRGEP